jgi:hypothetical protein
MPGFSKAQALAESSPFELEVRKVPLTTTLVYGNSKQHDRKLGQLGQFGVIAELLPDKNWIVKLGSRLKCVFED